MKQARILFFVNGVAPTSEDFAEADKISAQVVFRNATAVPPDGALEIADGVAGHVPARYAEAYPTAAEAIAKKRNEYETARKQTGDVPAPKLPVGKPADAAATSASTAPAPAPTQAPAEAPATPVPAAGTAAAPKPWGQAAPAAAKK